MQNGKKLDYKMLAIIILPIALLFLIFLVYKKMTKEDQSILKKHEAFFIPEVSDTSETMKSKAEQYEREKKFKENEEYENKQERFGVSDFFSVTAKLEDTTQKDTVSFFDQADKSVSSRQSTVGSRQPVVNKKIIVKSTGKTEKKPAYMTKYEDKEKEEKESVEVKILERTGKTVDGSFAAKTISKTKNINAVLNNYDREIRSGATLVLRLTEDFVIGNKTIKKNTLIYGIASLTKERVKVSIQTVKFGNEIIPVNMVVHDMDGIEGIYIPGGIDQEIAEEGADDTVDGGGEFSINVPLIGTAGGKVAKKKVKNPTVKVQDGYKVLLVFK